MMKSVRRLSLVAFAILSVLSAQAVANKDWYVSDDMQYGRGIVPDANCTNDLQAAIDGCSGNYTVWVTNGFVCSTGQSYGDEETRGFGRIHLKKNVTVRSEAGYVDEANGKGAKITGAPDPTSEGLGEAAVRCVNASYANAKLIGFILENGYTKNHNSYGYGGGVLCGTSAVVSNCVIRKCRANRGCATSRGSLYGCVMTNNAAGDSTVHRPVYMERCTVSDNAACGLKNNDADNDLVVTNSTFSGNVSSSVGSGVYQCSTSRDLTLCDCIISNNVSTSKHGGGVSGSSASGGRKAILHRCVIVGNTLHRVDNAHGGGGAAYCKLYDCIIRDNLADGVDGGGLGKGCVAHRCSIFGNKASNNGGGAVDSVLYNCVVTNNAILSESTTESGGGGTCDCDVFNSLVVGNSSPGGAGGMYGGSAINCTVTGNTTTGTKKPYGGLRSVSPVVNVISFGNSPNSNYGGSCTNSCLAGLKEPKSKSGCFSTNPNLDVRYAPRSRACKNKAFPFDWMTDPNDARSKDVYGAARVQGKGPDIGAVEQPDYGMILLLR